jgi:hypothetical protein
VTDPGQPAHDGRQHAAPRTSRPPTASIGFDPAGVAYRDLAGLQVVIGVTRGAGSGSRFAVLHEVPRHLTKVLQILGWGFGAGALPKAAPAGGCRSRWADWA